MPSANTAPVLKAQDILFPNANKARLLLSPAEAEASAIAAALQLPPFETVLLVIGGADNLAAAALPRLTQLVGRGLVRAAIEAKAILLDGGTRSGIMELTGKGVAGNSPAVPLIGVAPAAKTSYPGNETSGTPLDPNHSHFVLVTGSDWGSETPTLFGLAAALAQKTGAAKLPALVLLAGGGGVAKMEVLMAVRQKLPLIVIEGSGGLADELATAWKNKATPPEEPVMAEIIADGRLQFQPIGDPVENLHQVIIRALGADKVLIQAWENFADYDLNANRQQKLSDQLQISILLIGLLGTTLAIVKQVNAPGDPADQDAPWPFVYQLLIIIPILLSILTTLSTRFKQANKWLLLRAGAESIKREIYRYRTGATYYKTKPQEQLAKKIEEITGKTMTTDVNASALLSYKKAKGFPPYMYAAQGGDDGFSFLAPEQYIAVRLGDQLNYFKKKTITLERTLKVLTVTTLIIGGLGTYLAAMHFPVWIALTTAFTGAITTYLAYRQTENTLVKYNQTSTNLNNIKAWWNALQPADQLLQVNIDTLVEHTEEVLRTEMEGWVQQMQNALAELRKNQAPPPQNGNDAA